MSSGDERRDWERVQERWGAGAIATFALLSAIYLGARISGAFALESAAARGASLALACAEALLMFAAYRGLSTFRVSVDRRAEANAQAAWWSPLSSPSVAILIPTLNESAQILERAIAGAVEQDYPHCTVWLLDDGNRPEVREVAERYGARYHTRCGREHAKAGNINSALELFERTRQRHDFIAILDADYVAGRNFASRTLALMHNPRVALVQTPMYFFNRDNFQAAFPFACVPDVLRVNHDITQVCRDASGGGICSGTSFLVRMSALRELGGIPVESLTEDLLLAHRLRTAGYQVVYLDEPLSLGLAAERLSAYVVQRRRWYRGFVQMARVRWRERSSLLRRCFSVEAQLRGAYLPVLATLILVLPAVYARLPDLALAALGPVQALAGVLAFLVHHAYLTRLTQGRFLPLYCEGVSIIKTLCGTGAWLDELVRPGKKHFEVTPKGLHTERASIHWPMLAGVLALGVWMLAGVSSPATPWSRYGLAGIVAILWAAYGLLALLIAALFCIELPERRSSTRVDGGRLGLALSVENHELPAALIDVSDLGAQIACGSTLQPEPGARVELRSSHFVARGKVVRRGSAGTLGVEFCDSDPSTRRKLLSFVYAAGRVSPIQKSTLKDLVLGVITRAGRFVRW